MDDVLLARLRNAYIGVRILLDEEQEELTAMQDRDSQPTLYVPRPDVTTNQAVKVHRLRSIERELRDALGLSV